MSFLVSKTLGLVSSKYRNLDDWIITYKELVDGSDICKKTRENRHRHINLISRALGGLTISAIKPCDLAKFISAEAKTRPQTAKRLLIELRCMMNSALENGWIDVNPAIAVRIVKAPTQRERLTLAMWRKMYLAAYDADGWGRRLLLLALITGQRRGDLVKMRFSDVYDRHLHIVQEKTGTKLALPLAMRLPQIDTSLEQAIVDCADYAVNPDYMLRKSTGTQLSCCSLSYKFECMRNAVYPAMADSNVAPSLHECRSLAARLYNGVLDTQDLLGHSSVKMTAVYHDTRNLRTDEYKCVRLQ